MKAEDYQFFQQSGYLPLGRILTDEELEFYLRLYDRDRDEKKSFWVITKISGITCMTGDKTYY